MDGKLHAWMMNEKKKNLIDQHIPYRLGGGSSGEGEAIGVFKHKSNHGYIPDESQTRCKFMRVVPTWAIGHQHTCSHASNLLNDGSNLTHLMMYIHIPTSSTHVEW